MTLPKRSEEKEDFLSPESYTGKGFNAEYLLTRIMEICGNAMARVFENGQNPDNLITLSTAIDALESILITKVESSEEYKQHINDIRDVVGLAKTVNGGLKLYTMLKKKYQALVKIAMNAYTEELVDDLA